MYSAPAQQKSKPVSNHPLGSPMNARRFLKKWRKAKIPLDMGKG